MIEIKIAVIVLCAICKLVGELWQHNLQRFVMPIVLAVGISLVSHVWWLGLTCLPMIAPLLMGYKVYGPSDGFDRGMWLFLIALVAALGCAITHHVSWFIYVPYCVIAGAWGATTRKLWNVIIAPISGLLIGSIIFFVR